MAVAVQCDARWDGLDARRKDDKRPSPPLRWALPAILAIWRAGSILSRTSNKPGEIMIWIIRICSGFLGWAVAMSLVYRFKNPHLSETQLFLDMISGKWFR